MKKTKRKGKLLQSSETGFGQISGEISLYGIIGLPLRHTASPAMHNRLFQHYKMQAVYIPMPMTREHLRSFVHSARFLVRGWNVTVPYKKEIIPYLDEMDEHACRMKSVNTVCNSGDVLKGYNTDFIGLRRAIKNHFRITLKGKDVCIIGAGGAAASALYLAVMEGAKNVAIINRTLKKAKDLAGCFKSAVSIHTAGRNTGEARQYALGSQIIINTTSLGLRASDALPLRKDALRKGQYVMDMIYNPGETRWLRKAKEKGCHTANGLEMLVHQGAEAFRIWTGKNPPVQYMKESAQKVIY